MLIGSFNHQIDQKNRFRLPSSFKQELGNKIVVTKSSAKSLLVMTEDEFKFAVIDKMHDISLFDEVAQKSLRLLLSSAHTLEIDAQGRFLLPTSLKEYANILKDIVFIGVGSRAEIWASEIWDEYSNGSNFTDEISKLSGYGV